ncbi:MAG: hypothetical protein AAF518_00345 [Spirochaetota bacterium]
MKYFLSLSLLLLACSSSVHQYNAGDRQFPGSLQEGKRIEASAEQLVIFHFSSDTNYVLQAVEKLNQQCPGGSIDGIVTRFSTAHGFLSWKNKIYLQGICLTKP